MSNQNNNPLGSKAPSTTKKTWIIPDFQVISVNQETLGGGATSPDSAQAPLSS